MAEFDPPIPTQTYGLIEATVERLKERLPDFACEYFPDKPENYRLNHPKGALLVQYLRSSYGNPDDCDAMIQERKGVVAVSIVARQLWGRDGAVFTVDRVELALMGYTVPGWRKFRLVENRFISQLAGIWTYLVAVGAECDRVEDLDFDVGPVVTRLTFDDDYDGLTVEEENP